MSNLKEFEFEGISLPINPDKAEFLPNVQNFIHTSLDPKNLKGIMGSILDLPKKQPVPVLLVGPTGSGKTATVRWLANQTNNSYRRIQLTGSITVDGFVGRTLLDPEGTYWVDGILTDAMRKGHWLLLDEINAALPEILFILNSILDDDKSVILYDKKDGEVVKPHPNFRLFAAMNPWQDYAGTKELNRSQVDRFAIVEYNYPKTADEIKIVCSHSGIAATFGKINNTSTPLIKRMVELANIIRKKNSEGEIVSICSTRQLIQWAQLSNVLDIKHAATLTIINKCDEDERLVIIDELNKLFRDGESIQGHIEAAKVAKAEEVARKKAEKAAEKLAAKQAASGTPVMAMPVSTSLDAEIIEAKRIATENITSKIIV